MSILERIAYYQNRRDEAPNQELARELANQRDIAGIREIASILQQRMEDLRDAQLTRVKKVIHAAQARGTGG